MIQETNLGHSCDLAKEIDELELFYPGNGCCHKLWRHWIQLRIIHRDHPSVQIYLKSVAAIQREKYNHLRSHTYMIHPFSKFRLWWDFFMIPTYSAILLYIPFVLAFYNEECIFVLTVDDFTSARILLKPTLIALHTIIQVDIILNFFVGYHNKNLNIIKMTPKAAAWEYIRGYFFIDMISSIPIYSLCELFIYEGKKEDIPKAIRILEFLPMFKIFRFATIHNNLNLLEKYLRIEMGFYGVSRTTARFFLYVHWLACLICYADILWADTVDTESLNVAEHYNLKLLDAMLTIGGDSYVGESKYAQYYIAKMFLMLMSHIFMFILIGFAVRWRLCETSSTSKYYSIVKQLHDYMNYKHLPRYMKKRLLLYYEFRYQKSYFQENKILMSISQQLQQEIRMHSCEKMVQNVTIFKDLPIALLIKIVSSLKLVIYLPNDVITKVNTCGDCMYFIASGTVAVFTHSGKEVCHLEDGFHFGEIALVIRGQNRTASVAAVEICELYKFERNDFIRAISPFPDLLSNIERIATERREALDSIERNKVITWKRVSAFSAR